jgi:hypothetical protein
VLLGVGSSQSVEYVFGDEGPKIRKKKKTVDFDYNINEQTLETVASNQYLGAELTNTMSWDKQVQKVVAKGNKALGFIRRNVGSCPCKSVIRAIFLLVESGDNSSCSSNVVTVPGSLE